jgi:serine phosphatase RsbU (regulator of sigma subunit)
VTDKGIPAALVMTATRTMIRTAAQQQATPGEVLAHVNELLYADIPARMFVTCFYAILTPQNGQLHYANAGHEPPFRKNGTGACELEATGMPLGMMPGTCYDEYQATLTPGESLFFYSDGLVEAHNPQHELFSFPRLTSSLTDYSGNPDLIQYLLQQLCDFTGSNWEQEDDVTMMVLDHLHT